MPRPPRTFTCSGCQAQITPRPFLYAAIRGNRAESERTARQDHGWSKTRAHGWRCPDCQARPPDVREEWVTCGTPGCKCARGGTARHGPYRYRYVTGADGQRRKQYLGKERPAGA